MPPRATREAGTPVGDAVPRGRLIVRSGARPFLAPELLAPGRLVSPSRFPAIDGRAHSNRSGVPCPAHVVSSPQVGVLMRGIDTVLRRISADTPTGVPGHKRYRHMMSMVLPCQTRWHLSTGSNRYLTELTQFGRIHPSPSEFETACQRLEHLTDMRCLTQQRAGAGQ
jgi:hypothetical protein